MEKKSIVVIFILISILLFCIGFLLGKYPLSKCKPDTICKASAPCVDEKSTKIIYVQKAKDGYLPSKLILDSKDESYSLEFNTCEGMASEKGYYKFIDGNLKFFKEDKKTQITEYHFWVSGENSLKFFTKEEFGCGPFNEDFFEKEIK